MNTWDLILTVLLTLGAVWGFLHGFYKEVTALLFWLLAAFVSYRYGPALADLSQSWWPFHHGLLVTSYAVLFLAVLLIAPLISLIGKRYAIDLQFGWPNQLLGAFFGLLLSSLLLVMLLLLLQMSPLSNSPAWKKSFLIHTLISDYAKALHYVKEKDVTHDFHSR